MMFFEVDVKDSVEMAFQDNEIKNTGSIKEIKKYLEEMAQEVVCDDEFNYFLSPEEFVTPETVYDLIAQKTIQFYIDREKFLVKKLSDAGIDRLTEKHVRKIIEEANETYSQDRLEKIIDKYNAISVEKQVDRLDTEVGTEKLEHNHKSTKSAIQDRRIKQISIDKFKKKIEEESEKQKATSYHVKHNDLKIDVSAVIETITNYSNFAKSYIVIFNRFSMIESIIKYFHEHKDDACIIIALNDMLRHYYAHENVIMYKIANSGVDMEILKLVSVIVAMMNTSENFSENIDLVHNLLLFDR